MSTAAAETSTLLSINRDVRFLDQVTELPDSDGIRHIPQFLRADPDMVRREGGDFLRRLVETAPLGGRRRFVTIDVKVHMLMRGWYACIPGWHCDDFHRPGGGQPDLAGIGQAWSEHLLLVVGSTALPEFITEPMSLPAPAALQGDRPLFARYHELIEARRPRAQAPLSGQWVRFSCLDFHRGRPADHHAWRLFVRFTESDHHQPWNERRTQSQVYLTEPFEQW